MSTMNMKPNRIALFLAKILGKPEGENIKPSNATEYYLNEIAENGGGGGGGALVVTITPSSPMQYIFDKTPAEVYAAIQSGKHIYGYLSQGGKIYCCQLTALSLNGETPVGYALSNVFLDKVTTYMGHEEGGVTTARKEDHVISSN